MRIEDNRDETILELVATTIVFHPKIIVRYDDHAVG